MTDIKIICSDEQDDSSETNNFNPEVRRFSIRRKSKELYDDEQMRSKIEQSKMKNHQIISSEKILKKTKEDSSQLVNNVKAAIIHDENEVKKKIEEKKRERFEKLERESIVGAAHYKEISKKWENLVLTNSPSEIHHNILEQKALCDAVIKEKSQLIIELIQEIDEMEVDFEMMTERQEEEVEINIDRCRQQIYLLKRCYEEQFKSNKNIHTQEFKNHFESSKKEFDKKLNSFDSNESEKLNAFNQMFQVWEKELDQLTYQKYRDYNLSQKKFDKAIQLLQLQYQEAKAALQLNREKLEYTYQVLRKREDEQSAVKSEQRRQLTRLYNATGKLKTEVATKEKINKNKKKIIHYEYEKMLEHVATSEKKFKQRQSAEEKKISEIWKMNDKSARLLVRRLKEVNEIIDTEILGQTTETLPVIFFEKIEPEKSQQFSYSTILFRLGLLTIQQRRQKKLKIPSYDLSQIAASKTISKLLENVVEVASHLIDPQTLTFTSHLSSEEQLLVKLDTIFTALKIQKDEEVEALLQQMHSKCVQRSSLEDEEIINKENIMKTIDEFLENRQEIVWLNKYYSKSSSLFRQPRLTKPKIEEYWAQYMDMVPKTKLQLWNNTCRGLQKLRLVNKEAKTLEEENEKFSRQNNELRCLLTPYLQSLRAPA